MSKLVDWVTWENGGIPVETATDFVYNGKND
jgi:hypothetical protein